MSDPLDPELGPFTLVEALEEPVLTPEEERHLGRVRRLRPGDAVLAGDGGGRWRPCRLGADGRSLDPAGEIEEAPPPSPELTVAFALVKGERPELVVQKLTEVGADRIVPFTARRSVVRWTSDKAAQQHERLLRVAREAAQQARRVHLPVVEPLTSFALIASRPGAVMANSGGRPIRPGDHLVLVGPEGGWSPEERESGLVSVGFGPHVLRAETAAITAGALLVDRREGDRRGWRWLEGDGIGR